MQVPCVNPGKTGVASLQGSLPTNFKVGIFFYFFRGSTVGFIIEGTEARLPDGQLTSAPVKGRLPRHIWVALQPVN